MDEKISALYSEYVIDGMTQEITPVRMLGGEDRRGYVHIIDESVDPDPFLKDYQTFPVAFAALKTRMTMSIALIDALWKDGHFRMGNLNIGASWCWNEDRLGNMAAFYFSVKALADYCDELGLDIREYDYSRAEDACSVDVSVGVDSSDGSGGEKPFSIDNPWLGLSAKYPFTTCCDPKSWIIYVPFETEWGTDDPDYFIDCYELVRELVEDGIILSGCTVSGGLGPSLEKYVLKTGAAVRLAEIKNYFEQRDSGRILSDDVPGVLFQIRDTDYDYIDAEFLLQDVAYFPLGNPKGGSLYFDMTDKSGIQTILESLISSQSSEGED